MEGMRTSLRNATLSGRPTRFCSSPPSSTAETSYADAWERSQRQIRKLVPLAQELKVIIGIENGLEQVPAKPARIRALRRRFSDPYLCAPISTSATSSSQAIRRIGSALSASASQRCTSRIFRLRSEWRNSRRSQEGEIDWPAVHKAFADIGYSGTATVELSAGDAEYLKEVSRRFDRILAG
jgi:hexulose-6-phosphate isomerase